MLTRTIRAAVLFTFLICTPMLKPMDGCFGTGKVCFHHNYQCVNFTHDRYKISCIPAEFSYEGVPSGNVYDFCPENPYILPIATLAGIILLVANQHLPGPVKKIAGGVMVVLGGGLYINSLLDKYYAQQ